MNYMLRIHGNCHTRYDSYREAAVSDEPSRPLQRMIDDVRERGYQIVGLDTAEIYDSDLRGPFTSPVILVENNGRHGAIARYDGSTFMGTNYRLYFYEPEKTEKVM